MSDFSILDLDELSKDTIALSPYYTDFNIDRIVKDINAYWKEDVSALYRYFPSDEKGQEYRKAIYEDISREGMFELLMDFRDGMKKRREILENKSRTRFKVQQAVMTLSEIRCYVEAVEKLSKGLSFAKIKSEGFNKLESLLKEYTMGREFIDLQQKASEILKDLSSVPIKIDYKDHFLTVSFEEVEGKYDSFLEKFSKENVGEKETGHFFNSKNPFGDSVEISVLEQEVLDIVYKNYPAVFDRLLTFVKENENYARTYILKLSEELSFYLSFYNFEQVMKKRGFYFTLAKKSSNSALAAEDLYDLALACQLCREGKFPVANDTRLEENENFFVLTGPNQGGKTTFARSLGQLIFFAKLGLAVPAKAAEIPYYSRILTHFSVEESVETGKGKLAEELSRLAPMMEDRTQKNDFVVINELFTTAANYDACIMGKRVLDHFIGQNCHGIYVTHLQELSREDKGIVSLRAMMDEEHRQNFKIVRSNDPALESSILLVEKHKLHYEQVKDRLEGARQ